MDDELSKSDLQNRKDKSSSSSTLNALYASFNTMHNNVGLKSYDDKGELMIDKNGINFKGNSISVMIEKNSIYKLSIVNEKLRYYQIILVAISYLLLGLFTRNEWLNTHNIFFPILFMLLIGTYLYFSNIKREWIEIEYKDEQKDREKVYFKSLRYLPFRKMKYYVHLEAKQMLKIIQEYLDLKPEESLIK